MRVHGMPARPIAVGIVLPPMPSWPQSVPRCVATNAASTWVGLEALVDAVDRGGEGVGRHLLVALLEELAELDEPGADDGDPVPAHVDLLLGRSAAL